MLFIFIIAISCHKEDYYTSGDVSLRFSEDTISFDTIFTTFGTVTKQLKVYNPYNKAVIISSIKLANNSSYVINISGQQDEASNVTLEAGDSLYIFVQANIKENNSDIPVTIKDSIIFITNGAQQDVKLISYAQDVNVVSDTIQSQTWSGSKPYLVEGNLVVDSLQTLTINPGVTIYMQKNANIIIKGNIQAVGTFEEPIHFRQDRFEEDYKYVPGYWGSISITPGTTTQNFDWVIIENGTNGLQIQNKYNISGASVNISNSIIQDMSYSCLYAEKTSIYAYNCVIANAKDYVCYLFGSGPFQFYHTTFANYYSPIAYEYRSNNYPTLYLTNYIENTAYTSGYESYEITNSFFRNCIIYGTYSNELTLDFLANINYDLSFDHCLIRKSDTTEYSGVFSNIKWNKSPKFVDGEYLDFKLDTLSAAINAGDLTWGNMYPTDLNDESRVADTYPDLGAYERINK